MNARELSNRLVDLLRNERYALADFLVALADFDRKRLWRELDHASLFYFLQRDLGLSTGSAFYRKTAAELVQEFPEIVEPLREGRLCLTTVVELRKVLTRENLPDVLPRFFHVSKQRAKEVAVEIKPEAVPSRVVVTAVPTATESHPFRPDETRACQLDASPQEGLSLTVNAASVSSALPAAAPPPMTVEPKTAEQSRLHLTVSRAFLRKLDAARDALSHSNPGASADAILEAGLDLLLERSARRKGLVKNPRKSPPARRPRTADPQALVEPPDSYVPAHVRREVWERDQGRCQFPLEGGGVCGSTYRVQLDHIIPVALGGTSDPKNLRCACQPHNLEAARRELGDAVMDRYVGRRRPPQGQGEQNPPVRP